MKEENQSCRNLKQNYLEFYQENKSRVFDEIRVTMEEIDADTENQSGKYHSRYNFGDMPEEYTDDIGKNLLQLWRIDYATFRKQYEAKYGFEGGMMFYEHDGVVNVQIRLGISRKHVTLTENQKSNKRKVLALSKKRKTKMQNELSKYLDLYKEIN